MKTQRRRTVAELDAAERQTAKRRWATVRVHPLNGGTGEVIRNFNRRDFEAWWKMLFPWAKEVPSRGVGSIGDGMIGFQWRIYRDGL